MFWSVPVRVTTADALAGVPFQVAVQIRVVWWRAEVASASAPEVESPVKVYVG